MRYYIFSTELKVLLCFLLAFFITFVLIPSIVEIARAKSLVAQPGVRTSHEKSIPTLGGIAIYTGFSISILIFFNSSSFPRFQYLIAGLLIIFFIGFKDDIIGISPMKKFLGQIIAALIVIEFGGIRFTDLHGFLGIHEINYHIGLLITLVTIVGITNCFNLMDGIDGLSASLGIVSSFTFGAWFYLTGQFDWAILCAGLIGSLSAFFIFNVFGKRNKIFMGDTGSLILGFFMAVMAIKFNEFNINSSQPYYIHAAPAVSVGILMVPIFDTLRVFISRIFRNSSPFSPDKTHIHHYLLQLGFSHFYATLLLFTFSIVFVLISFWLQDLTAAWLLIVLMILGYFLSMIPITLVKWKTKRALKRSMQEK
jgi:UDP-N-acetylmuramyl pentapeptide phosphotransferase/UDP-N-acetylglucosamine-1-phosphate transferase